MTLGMIHVQDNSCLLMHSGGFHQLTFHQFRGSTLMVKCYFSGGDMLYISYVLNQFQDVEVQSGCHGRRKQRDRCKANQEEKSNQTSTYCKKRTRKREPRLCGEYRPGLVLHWPTPAEEAKSKAVKTLCVVTLYCCCQLSHFSCRFIPI